jgi:hypothetical protein
MPRFQRITVVLAALCIATPLAAQGITPRNEQPADSTRVAVPATVELSASPAAVAAPATAVTPAMSLAPTRANAVAGLQLRTEGLAPAPVPEPGKNSGNTALMLVGGAALIVGAVIGGDAGTIIMIGGAGVGLYGLWQYLK